MKKKTVLSCSPRTAVAYARYSSAGQRDVSIDQQLADIRAFAKREGYTIVHEYADHARSGYKNTSARTAFQSMMAAAESGAFDTVISWKVDRFGRNREESALFKGRLRRFGDVRFDLCKIFGDGHSMTFFVCEFVHGLPL